MAQGFHFLGQGESGRNGTTPTQLGCTDMAHAWGPYDGTPLFHIEIIGGSCGVTIADARGDSFIPSISSDPVRSSGGGRERPLLSSVDGAVVSPSLHDQPRERRGLEGPKGCCDGTSRPPHMPNHASADQDQREASVFQPQGPANRDLVARDSLPASKRAGFASASHGGKRGRVEGLWEARRRKRQALLRGEWEQAGMKPCSNEWEWKQAAMRSFLATVPLEERAAEHRRLLANVAGRQGVTGDAQVRGGGDGGCELEKGRAPICSGTDHGVTAHDQGATISSGPAKEHLPVREAEAEVGAEVEAEAGAEAEVEAGAAAGAKTRARAGAGAEAEAEAEADVGAEVETEAGAEARAWAEAEVEAGAAAGAATRARAGAEAEAEVEVAAEAEARARAEAEVLAEAEVEVEAGVEAGAGVEAEAEPATKLGESQEARTSLKCGEAAKVDSWKILSKFGMSGESGWGSKEGPKTPKTPPRTTQGKPLNDCQPSELQLLEDAQMLLDLKTGKRQACGCPSLRCECGLSTAESPRKKLASKKRSSGMNRPCGCGDRICTCPVSSAEAGEREGLAKKPQKARHRACGCPNRVCRCSKSFGGKLGRQGQSEKSRNLRRRACGCPNRVCRCGGTSRQKAKKGLGKSRPVGEGHVAEGQRPAGRDGGGCSTVQGLGFWRGREQKIREKALKRMRGLCTKRCGCHIRKQCRCQASGRAPWCSRPVPDSGQVRVGTGKGRAEPEAEDEGARNGNGVGTAEPAKWKVNRLSRELKNLCKSIQAVREKRRDSDEEDEEDEEGGRERPTELERAKNVTPGSCRQRAGLAGSLQTVRDAAKGKEGEEEGPSGGEPPSTGEAHARAGRDSDIEHTMEEGSRGAEPDRAGGSSRETFKISERRKKRVHRRMVESSESEEDVGGVRDNGSHRQAEDREEAGRRVGGGPRLPRRAVEPLDPGVPFKIGDKVEVRSFLKGFRGAWFRCKVVDFRQRVRRQGSTAPDLQYLVQYLDYKDKPQWASLYEQDWARQDSPSPPWELMIRPMPPRQVSLVAFESGKVRLRGAAEGEVVVVQEATWGKGDKVDFMCEGCWWAGSVVKTRGTWAWVKLLAFPEGEYQGELDKAKCRNLRASLEWNEGRWALLQPEVDGRPLAGRIFQLTELGAFVELKQRPTSVPAAPDHMPKLPRTSSQSQPKPGTGAEQDKNPKPGPGQIGQPGLRATSTSLAEEAREAGREGGDPAAVKLAPSQQAASEQALSSLAPSKEAPSKQVPSGQAPLETARSAPTLGQGEKAGHHFPGGTAPENCAAARVEQDGTRPPARHLARTYPDRTAGKRKAEGSLKAAGKPRKQGRVVGQSLRASSTPSQATRELRQRGVEQQSLPASALPKPGEQGSTQKERGREEGKGAGAAADGGSPCGSGRGQAAEKACPLSGEKWLSMKELARRMREGLGNPQGGALAVGGGASGQEPRAQSSHGPGSSAGRKGLSNACSKVPGCGERADSTQQAKVGIAEVKGTQEGDRKAAGARKTGEVQCRKRGELGNKAGLSGVGGNAGVSKSSGIRDEVKGGGRGSGSREERGERLSMASKSFTTEAAESPRAMPVKKPVKWKVQWSWKEPGVQPRAKKVKGGRRAGVGKSGIGAHAGGVQGEKHKERNGGGTTMGEARREKDSAGLNPLGLAKVVYAGQRAAKVRATLALANQGREEAEKEGGPALDPMGRAPSKPWKIKHGFRGVDQKGVREFQARCRDGKGRYLYLGQFPTAEAAARKVDEEKIRLFGAEASGLNFPLEEGPE